MLITVLASTVISSGCAFVLEARSSAPQAPPPTPGLKLFDWIRLGHGGLHVIYVLGLPLKI